MSVLVVHLAQFDSLDSWREAIGILVFLLFILLPRLKSFLSFFGLDKRLGERADIEARRLGRLAAEQRDKLREEFGGGPRVGDPSLTGGSALDDVPERRNVEPARRPRVGDVPLAETEDSQPNSQPNSQPSAQPRPKPPIKQPKVRTRRKKARAAEGTVGQDIGRLRAGEPAIESLSDWGSRPTASGLDRVPTEDELELAGREVSRRLEPLEAEGTTTRSGAGGFQPTDWRRAIVLREILGAPRAFEDFEFRA